MSAITKNDFRQVMSLFATGVAVVTARGKNGAEGATISALSSVSLDPLLLLICLKRGSSTCLAIEESGEFSLSILSKKQEDMAMFFATPSAEKNIETATFCHENGGLFVQDALAHISCKVKEKLAGGTHEIFLSEPVGISGTSNEPLLYYKGKFNLF